MKRIVCLALIIAMIFALSGCGKSENVKNFENLVSKIGEVTIDSESAIKEAEKAFDSLTEKEKEQTTKNADLKQMRADYTQKVENAKIAEVEKLIEDIQEVSLENSVQSYEAKAAYDKLTSENKEKVKNVDKLNEAIEEIKELKRVQAESLLAGMRLEEDRVQGRNFYYPKAMRFYSNGSWAADIRCFILPYIGREDLSNYSWLRLIYNYTGDDWVFYESIIVAVDGKRYNKTFNYFDIVHDNEAGDVWEYIDTEVSDHDVEMLWAIANSQETIVRFQGNNYSHDYTISETDKQAIREVLTAYEALQ